MGVFLLLAAISICLNAQQQPQTGYPDGAENTLDCSDPAQAASPVCVSRSVGNTESQTPRLPLSPSSPNGDYADTEQLSRQPSVKNPEIHVPPAPLTEFQKFAASTTGQVLPIFGANLFRRVPSTFAPVDMAPVPPDFVIGPGDEIRIRVWGQLSFQANVRVDRSGDIYLPQVGPIHVASIPFAELDQHLRSAIGRVFHNFDLTVDLGQIRSIQVYLAGEANAPGVYTVSSLSTLVDALFASGGPKPQGSLRNIELRRGGETVTHFDLYEMIVRGYRSKDAKLLPGDIIFIPSVGPQVAILGSVKNLGIYELLPGESLADALADAGGVSTVASAARISIERIEKHSERQAMEVAYDKDGLATALADGDIVKVDRKSVV